MIKFYLAIWLRWCLRITVTSFSLAILLSFIISLGAYFFQGAQPFSKEIFDAMRQVFLFWFPISWSISLLISLFTSLKYIFNMCHMGYELKLLDCQTQEPIEIIGYGDITKVWRKWFMVIIWIVSVEMILSLIVMKYVAQMQSIFDWFNIYILFVYILLSGFFSFILLSTRCKKVKVKRC